MARRLGKNKFRQKWSMHKGPRHHLLLPSYYIGRRPQDKGIRGCDLVVGRKRGSTLGFPLKLLWEKCLAGIASHPKEVRMSWDHLIRP